jgi:sugar phosphate isomerase/epimerase
MEGPRISFSTAALWPRDSELALRLLARVGFPNAELMPQCLADTTPEFARKARSITRVASIHFPLAYFSVLYNAHPGMAAEARAMCATIVESAAILGAEVIVIHAHAPAEPAMRELLEKPIVDTMLRLGDLAAAAGLTVALENNPKTEARTPEGLAAYCRCLGHAAIKPMVDVTESFEAGIDPRDFLAAVEPCHLHLSDHRGDQKHIPAGEGETDWPGVAARIRAWDYRGLWTFEPGWKHYLEDVESRLAKAREFAESL